MLTLSTSPEQENLLRAEAQKMGLSAEQLLLNLIAERLPQIAPTTPARPVASDDEDETAAMDELVGCLADIPTRTTSWRRLKEEEMALEEEKFLRHFRSG